MGLSASTIAIMSAVGTAATVASTLMAANSGKKAPTITPPTTMPTTNDADVRRKKMREAAALMQRSGSQSTILSKPNPSGGATGQSGGSAVGNSVLTTPGSSSTL
jgi:hypothetical protein